MRQIEFLDTEIAAVERLIAQQALAWPEIRRLMTVPGVNLICAASFMAAIGDPHRFLTSRKLVAYLGLGSQGPPVRRAAGALRPDLQARLSVRALGAGRGRVERGPQPGPLHAFYERIRARRGHGKAIVATARKLAVLFWCMLTRGEDYAHQHPSLTSKKLRRLELTAGAPRHHGTPPGSGPPTSDARRRTRSRRASRGLLRADGPDQQAGAPARKVGASVTPERA